MSSPTHLREAVSFIRRCNLILWSRTRPFWCGLPLSTGVIVVEGDSCPFGWVAAGRHGGRVGVAKSVERVGGRALEQGGVVSDA